MIDYKEYEKSVYNWLSDKNKQEPSFTFSLRQNGSKGAETDYFIGTEKSRYFGTTFWSIPVGYPGSSGDCIDLIFQVSANYLTYSYNIEFTQTNSPEEGQNTSVLHLIKSLVNPLDEAVGNSYTSPANNKMCTVKTRSKKDKYSNLDEMLADIDKDLDLVLPLVEECIEKEILVNPEFVAHRISQDEFLNMKTKLENRFEKYSGLEKFKNENNATINELDNKFSNYWIFQGSPDIYNITNALKAAHLKSWKVAAHKDKIKIGDKVIIWQTGKKAGCYALAEVTSEVSIFEEEAHEKWYYTNKLDASATDRVRINIIKYLAEDPILWKNIKDNSNFSAFKAGNQGTNFCATEKEFNALLNWEQLNNNPLNQIFYGPPGTGKTYKLKNELFPKYTSKETSLSKEKYFENIVSNCSWWQVIAVALIQLGEVKVVDIIEHPWVKKRAELSKSNNIRPTIWGRLQGHTINECKNVNVTSKSTPLIFSKDDNSIWKIEKDIVDELAPEIYDLIDKVENFEANPDKEIKRYKFITFHQSFSYEDFIEGIKPKLIDEESTEKEEVSYTIESGVFKEICKDAERDPENRYAIFIDEINRGNISSIFGELITLIEQDKRKGLSNELTCILPYSKSEFSVPKNLDIYGTMNTADRSVEALDTALRRRFSFEEMMPKPALVKTEGESGKVDGIIETIDLEKLLITINNRIEKLIDRDHKIGHSYFLVVDNLEKLKNCFQNKIIPLLQEYFFGDYGKIGLVLGEGFFENNNESKNEVFANFTINDYDADGLSERQVFHLLNAIKMDDNEFLNAINLLLGNKSA